MKIVMANAKCHDCRIWTKWIFATKKLKTQPVIINLLLLSLNKWSFPCREEKIIITKSEIPEGNGDYLERKANWFHWKWNAHCLLLKSQCHYSATLPKPFFHYRMCLLGIEQIILYLTVDVATEVVLHGEVLLQLQDDWTHYKLIRPCIMHWIHTQIVLLIYFILTCNNFAHVIYYAWKKLKKNSHCEFPIENI